MEQPLGFVAQGEIGKVCCSREDREGLLPPKVFEWFETESP